MTCYVCTNLWFWIFILYFEENFVEHVISLHIFQIKTKGTYFWADAIVIWLIRVMEIIKLGTFKKRVQTLSPSLFLFLSLSLILSLSLSLPLSISQFLYLSVFLSYTHSPYLSFSLPLSFYLSIFLSPLHTYSIFQSIYLSLSLLQTYIHSLSLSNTLPSASNF